jgi:hypothetical protein
LQYIDARGTGRGDDLLFVYQPQRAPELIFAVVVVEGRSYPLITDPASGSLGRAVRLERIEGLNLFGTHGQARWEVRFVWNSNGFAPLGPRPPSP